MQRKSPPPTLLLASMSLPSARQLAGVAHQRGWNVCVLDKSSDVSVSGPRTFYGGSDRAAEYAARFELCLIEPPLDLLARAPADLLCRPVRLVIAAPGAKLAGSKAGSVGPADAAGVI